MQQKILPYQHSDGKFWEHFYVDPRTNIIYFKRRFNGKKIKFSTKLTTSQAVHAKRFANAEFERRIGKRKVFLRNTLAEHLDAYLKIKEAEGLKYDTLNNVRRAVKSLKKYWGDKFPDEIDRDGVVEWIIWFKENHEVEMENDIKYFRNFCKYLNQKVENGRAVLPAVPTIRDPDRNKIKARRKKKKEQIITAEEFKKILNSATSVEEKTIVLFMYTMAMRIDETLKLEIGNTLNLEFINGGLLWVYRWKVDQNKASLEGMHLCHKSLETYLNHLSSERSEQKTNCLFPQKLDNQKAISAQQIDWDGWRERADLGWHWTPHTFRHTCLSNLFNDETNNQIMICKQYRVSMEVAMDTYIKVKLESVLKLKDAIKVDL